MKEGTGLNDVLPGTKARRRIYLMRHGEVAYFDANGDVVHPKFVQLTETGQAQARAAQQMLAGIALDRVLTSGLPRTMETAGLALKGHDLNIEVRENLKELRSGKNTGRTPQEVRAEFTRGMTDAAAPGARFAGGDLYGEFYDRVTGEFASLLLEPDWRRMLIVAHEGTNRMILGWACGGGLATVGAFEQDPACINVIDADVVDGALERVFIKLMNATPINHPKDGNYLTSMEQVFDLRDRRLGK
jgi:broad specificity phosphatase PhoE